MNGYVHKGRAEEEADALLARFGAQLQHAADWRDEVVSAFSAALAEAALEASPLLAVPHAPEDCPTWYDGCNCTVSALEHNIERAERAEAERDAAGAALCAAMPPIPGAKDRTLADLVTQIIGERDRFARLYADAIEAARTYERALNGE